MTTTYTTPSILITTLDWEVEQDAALAQDIMCQVLEDLAERSPSKWRQVVGYLRGSENEEIGQFLNDMESRVFKVCTEDYQTQPQSGHAIVLEVI